MGQSKKVLIVHNPCNTLREPTLIHNFSFVLLKKTLKSLKLQKDIGVYNKKRRIKAQKNFKAWATHTQRRWYSKLYHVIWKNLILNGAMPCLCWLDLNIIIMWLKISRWMNHHKSPSDWGEGCFSMMHEQPPSTKTLEKNGCWY